MVASWTDFGVVLLCAIYGWINFFEFANQAANVIFLFSYPNQLVYVLIITVQGLGHLFKLIACVFLCILVLWGTNCCCGMREKLITRIAFFTSLAGTVGYDLYLVYLLFEAPAGSQGFVEKATLIVIIVLTTCEFLAYIPINSKLCESESMKKQRKYAYVTLPSRTACVDDMPDKQL